MGYGRRRYGLFGTSLPPPQPALATVDGITHRLKWLTKDSGYRMGCSCGWFDPLTRWTQDNAVNEGNRHVRLAQRGRYIAAPDPNTVLLQSIANANATLLNTMRQIVDGAQRAQRAAEADGGPQSRQSALALTEAAINCERLAHAGIGKPVVLAMGQLSDAARTWEQACHVDGLPQWFEPARVVADEALKMLHAAEQMAGDD